MTTIADVQEALLSRFGLCPGDGWRESLPRVLRDVVAISRISERELLDRVLQDPGLLREIAGRITVPESYFFRHPEQLEAVCDHISQKLTSVDAASQVQVWSAGCSQGEEPYSVAILLRERLSALLAARVSIFANDISGVAISAAKEGIYTPWSFRITSEAQKLAYFEMLDERRFRLLPDIRTMVSFVHGSIQDQLFSLMPASVDVILFRNVAIYLSETALAGLFAKFTSVLKPGGLLCLSSSDPPVQSSELVKLNDASMSIYQRRMNAPAKFPVLKVNLPVSPLRTEVKEKRVEKVSIRNDDQLKTEAEYRKAMFDEPLNPMARFWYAITLFEKNAQNRSMAQMNALADDLEKLDRTHVLNDGETTAGELLKTVRTFLEKIPMQRRV